MITIKNDAGEVMTVGELKRHLADFPDDMQIVRPTNRGTLSPIFTASEITTIRSRLHEKTDILPMIEYRVPWNPEDEPDETRRKVLLLK